MAVLDRGAQLSAPAGVDSPNGPPGGAMTEILFELDARGIGTLTINRPHVRNGLGWAAMRAFADAVEQAHAAAFLDPVRLEATRHNGAHAGPGHLSALIVTGAGSAFASGGDIAELQAYPTRADGLRL